MRQQYLSAQAELNRRDQEKRLERAHAIKASEHAHHSAGRAATGGSNPTTPARRRHSTGSHAPSPNHSSAAAAHKENTDRAGGGKDAAAERVPPPPNGQTLFATLARGGVAQPDPSMVWGVDDTVLTMVKSNALVQVNEQLREKLHECEAVIRAQQNDMARLKKANESLASDLQNVTLERSHILHERDSIVHKLATAEAVVDATRRQLRDAAAQHDHTRGTLEQQCRELRSKTILLMEERDTLSKQRRSLQLDFEEARVKLATTEGRSSTADSAAAAQRQVNENLIAELTNLNELLAKERRQVLDVNRELHMANEQRRRVDELEMLLQAARREALAVEQENLRLLAQSAKLQESAVAVAREAADADLKEARERAAHWEQVCRLQFRDIELRTKQHLHTRDELDAVRKARDEAEVHLLSVRGDAEACRAKLNVVWPSHDRDAHGMTPDAIRKAFAPRASRTDTDGAGTSPAHTVMALRTAARIMEDLGPNASSDVVIDELREANACLVSEVEGLRAANEILSRRLDQQTATNETTVKESHALASRYERREAARLEATKHYANRVDFLEQQVRTLRGAPVETSFSLTDLDPTCETVIELQLGQLVIDGGVVSAGASARFWGDFPVVFATVDFLVHETVATDAVATSTTAFFDQVLAYRVKTDALLLHNLTCRTVLVELHRVTRGSDYETVGRGAVSLAALIDAARLKEARPELHTHVDVCRLKSSTEADPNDVLARIELTALSRRAFPSAFVAMCESANADSAPANTTLGGNESTASTPSVFESRVETSTAHVPAPPKSLSATDAADLLAHAVAVRLEFKTVRIDFSLPQSPLLSLWYCLDPNAPSDDPSGAGERWVLPESATARYEYAFNSAQRHALPTTTAVFGALREPTAVVAFADDDSATDFWAVGSLELAQLLLNPRAAIDVAVAMVSATGQRLATLEVQARLEWDGGSVPAAPPQRPTPPPRRAQV